VGASRMHIIRQILIESTLLSVIGMLLGMGFAWVGIRWIASALPVNLAQTTTLGIDLRVLLFALGISLATGLFSGIIPAIIACRRNATSALRDGDRSGAGQEGGRIRAMLVAGTFALALALTVSAGLFLKSLVRILQVDPGFDPGGVLTFTLSLPEAQYPDREALRPAQDALLERLSAVPGVTGVGFTSTLPMGDLVSDTGTAIEGVPLEGDPLRTWYSRATRGYLPALGVPILRGRDFSARDTADAPCVVIANETYVQRYMEGLEPIGRRVILNPQIEQYIHCEIIGLAKDLRFNTLAEPPEPTLYLSASRFPNRRFFVALRTAQEPLSLLPTVRQAVAGFDPGLAVWSPATMNELVANTMRTPRLVTMLVGAFAALALVLAASGVYGVATYNVKARMREFGVRTALGAKQFDLLRHVLMAGLRLVGAGMAVGIILTIAFGRLLDALLYEVEPFDAQVFAAVALLLAAAAVLAMLVPARRAARVHPMEALRYE
ncbi:MAG TPA: FtsX-like permease family protein, partial [Pseudomonadales bacterium]